MTDVRPHATKNKLKTGNFCVKRSINKPSTADQFLPIAQLATSLLRVRFELASTFHAVESKEPRSPVEQH
ncbi:hypothetical protein OKW96_18965 [Sphingobacterium sp. KU25419]|nr:hypothetical protein OKW96_18965 [Sphingobacterium sp. KU25419]